MFNVNLSWYAILKWQFPLCFCLQALYLLLQCGHNVEEAQRRRKMQAVPPTGQFHISCSSRLPIYWVC